LGIHPYYVEQHQEEDLERLAEKLLSRSERCVAVGECGLDYYHSKSNAAKQERFFVQQIKLANTYKLPLIVHSRNAHQQIIKLLNQHSTEKKGVIHAFSGSYQQALDYIKLGFYIGVGGTITYPRAKKTRETISRLPLESLVLETDAPDMPIFGQQGQENHPKNLRNILNELILLRSESEQTIAGQVFRNSQSMYLICE
jgi:TatD DNase family protein